MTDTVELEADLVADNSLYPALLSRRGRTWFVGKIVVHSSTAVDVATKSRQYVQQAKTIVEGLIDRPQPYAAPFTHLAVVTFLAHILYTTLGTNPSVFLDQTNSALLTFVSERRLRTIMQMRDHVNGRFRFPADIEHSRLRSTQTHWEGVNQVGAGKLWPFVLKPGANVDRKAAVEELFGPGPAANTNTTDVNAVECQTAASMVLLDSLLQADNPKTLLDELNRVAGGYLTIDNPDGAHRVVGGGWVGALRILAEPVAPGTGVVLKAIPPLIEDTPPFNVVLLDSAGVTETVTIQTIENPSPTQLLAAGVPVTAENIAKALIRTAAPPALPSRLTATTLIRSFDPGTRLVSAAVPPVHFLSDPRPQIGLFEQGSIPVEDLQPGDVVHVLGHPLTRHKIPTSPFGGERSVVVDPRALTTYLISITGHGVGERSLNDLGYLALIAPNRLLTVARQVLDNCLGPLMQGIPAAMGTSSDADNTIVEIVGRALSLNPSQWNRPGFFADGNWEVHNFPAIHEGDLDWWAAEIDRDPLRSFPGYPMHWALAMEGHLDLGPLGTLAFDAGDLFAFGYWPIKQTDMDFTWDTIVSRNFVGLLRSSVHNSASTDPTLQYVIPYFDDQSGLLLNMPLHDKVSDDTAIPTVLTYSDLAPQLFRLGKDDTEAWVVRPRVSADPAYLRHLRDIGALPAAP